jgi:hypothetical protein
LPALASFSLYNGKAKQMNFKALPFLVLMTIAATSMAQDNSSTTNLLSGNGRLQLDLGNEWVGAALEIINEEGDVVTTHIVDKKNVDLSFTPTSFQFVVRLRKQNREKEYVYLNTSVAVTLESADEPTNLKKWLTSKRKKFKVC